MKSYTYWLLTTFMLSFIALSNGSESEKSSSASSNSYGSESAKSSSASSNSYGSESAKSSSASSNVFLDNQDEEELVDRRFRRNLRPVRPVLKELRLRHPYGRNRRQGRVLAYRRASSTYRAYRRYSRPVRPILKPINIVPWRNYG